MTTQPQMPAEMHPQRHLGHTWRVTVQERYGQDERIDRDKRVWIGCTCGWWPSPHYPTVDDAVEAFWRYHRPNDRPASDEAAQAAVLDGHR